jgi:hypothetical protein
MTKRLTSLAVALAALASSLSFTSTASAQPVPTVLNNAAFCPFTWDTYCKFVTKPTSWGWTGDGSASVGHLHWTSWGGPTATATGMAYIRTCWGGMK